MHKCTYTCIYNVHVHVGQPVAWAITDKEDVDTLEAIWTVIKRQCPDVTVKTLMSEDGITYMCVCTCEFLPTCMLSMSVKPMSKVYHKIRTLYRHYMSHILLCRSGWCIGMFPSISRSHTSAMQVAHSQVLSNSLAQLIERHYVYICIVRPKVFC